MSRPSTLGRALLAALLLAAPAAGQKARDGRFSVEAFDLNTDPHVTVRAEAAPALDVLAGLAARLDLELVGAEQIGGERRVDVYLVRRPARDAIRWVLGGAGLRARVTRTQIVVEEDVPATPTDVELLTRAYTAHQLVLRSDPDRADADRIEMALADISADLGPAFYAQAVASYERVADEHPDSELVPDALLRAARLHEAQGRWSDAVLRYHQLADLDATHHAHRPEALLAIARCLCHTGEGTGDGAGEEALRENARKALLTLDVLENGYPDQRSLVRRERLLVRAMALSLTDDPLRAMKTADAAAALSLRGDRDPEVLEVRALAFARAGRHGDASTAWLRLADVLEGDDQARAFRRAGQEALAGHHELATLFIDQTARNAGHGDLLADLVNEAELRLDLGGERVTALTPEQELVRAERLVERRMYEQAVLALRPHWVSRAQRPAALRPRIAAAYARALEGRGLDEEALGVLRLAAAELDSRYEREHLYQQAADLHERRGRYSAAIEALKGNL